MSELSSPYIAMDYRRLDGREESRSRKEFFNWLESLDHDQARELGLDVQDLRLQPRRNVLEPDSNRTIDSKHVCCVMM